MRVFLLKICLFAVIVIGICYGLSEIEFSDDFIIEKTRNTDYEKIAWNLQMINNHPEEIKNSIVFMGSSYVLGGINDSILSSNGLKAYNFGIRHNGNELGLYFLNRIKTLGPKAVMFQKGKVGTRGLHKLTPLLYTPGILLSEGQGLNLFFIGYLFKRTKLTIEYLFSFTSSEIDYIKDLASSEYGIIYDKKQIDIESFKLENTRSRFRRTDENFNLYLNGFLFHSEKQESSMFNRFKVLKRKFVFNYWLKTNLINNKVSQENFLDAAQKTCNSNNIIFSRIYIPVISDLHYSNNYNRSHYTPSSADVNMVDFRNYDFLDKAEFWADDHHLNQKGAKVYAEKLVKNNIIEKVIDFEAARE